MPNFSLSHKRVKVAFSMAARWSLADLRQVRRDPAQGPPNSNRKLIRDESRKHCGHERAKKLWRRGLTGAMAMKLFTWAVAAGLVVAASTANAQMLAPNDAGTAHYRATSDLQRPRPH